MKTGYLLIKDKKNIHTIYPFFPVPVEWICGRLKLHVSSEILNNNKTDNQKDMILYEKSLPGIQ